MSSKRNTAADRDALFGSAGRSKKKSNAANRDALFGSVSKKSSNSSSNRAARPSTSRTTTSSASSSTDSRPTPSSTRGYKPKVTTVSSATGRSVLSGEARAAKMKEAEEWRAKAKKAMARGVFAKPDPTAGSMFYKRAADAYQQCGEVRLERIHREASADAQIQMGAFATGAADYTRAAELIQVSNESTEEKRKEGCRLHSAAAKAFRDMGENGKAAECTVNAALALLWEDETTLLSKEALAKMEEAVEAYVPDPMNRYARYRQLGISVFVDPDAETDVITPDMMDLAKQHMVTKAYAYEPVHKLAYVFCHYGEYASALYAMGAATAILEAEGIATLTLSRNYVMETILQLAMGDPVAAERAFLDWHVQKTSYLTSRECKLAEELFRAVLSRDEEELDEARSSEGSNRAALANLNEEMRTVVQQLRISGVARRKGGTKTSAATKKKVDEELARELGTISKASSSSKPKPTKKLPKPTKKAPEPAVEHDLNEAFIGDDDDESESSGSDLSHPESSEAGESSDEEEEVDERMDAAALKNEMDDLMNDMGLDSDSEEDLSDDEIDLR